MFAHPLKQAPEVMTNARREGDEQMNDGMKELTRAMEKAVGEELKSVVERLRQLHRERRKLGSRGMPSIYPRR